MNYQNEFHKTVINGIIVGIKEARVQCVAEDRPILLAKAILSGSRSLSNLDWADDEDFVDAAELADDIAHDLESNGYSGRAARMTTKLTKLLEQIVDSIKV